MEDKSAKRDFPPNDEDFEVHLGNCYIVTHVHRYRKDVAKGVDDETTKRD